MKNKWLILISTITFIYLLGAFVINDIDFSNWEFKQRFFIAGLIVISTSIIFVVDFQYSVEEGVNDKLNEIKENEKD